MAADDTKPPPGSSKTQSYEIFNAGRSEERNFPSGPTSYTPGIASAGDACTATSGPTTDAQGRPLLPRLTKGDANTTTEAGVSQKPPSFTEGVQSIKGEDFLRVHKIPCARNGFLVGIGAGAVVGMGRFVFGGRIWQATNWAMGSFLIGSIGQWEYCQYKIRQEKAGMARVIEVMDRKQAEKKAQAQEVMTRRKEAAEERARQEAEKKRWYKFW